MIDSGASISFIHQNLALQHQFTTTNQTLNISLADGSIHKSTSATRLVLQSTNTHFETHPFQLIPLGNYPVILGMDWLRKHNPHLDWIKGTATFPCSDQHTHTSLSPVALATLPRILPTFLDMPPVPSTLVPHPSPRPTPQPAP
jgi:hypothetical protein